MAEFIEQNKLTCRDCYHHEVCDGFGFVLDPLHGGVICDSFVKAADVVEVKHGLWEDKPTGAYGRWQSWCSACGKHSGIGGIESNRHKPYCPHCGARMDGDV